MKVFDLVMAMEKLAPTRYAEAWDNVGLLVGDPNAAISKVLLCIDLTPSVLVEAEAKGCQAVIAYHPPIFEGLKRLTVGEVAFEAARKNIAVYSPHTALDVAPGGTNDVLCEMLGIGNARALKPYESKAGLVKLVTFLPVTSVEQVAEAIYSAGGGSIGAYSKCSFRSEGTGTFLGDASTHPAVGEKGKLTFAPEVKFETIMPAGKMVDVVAALKAAHPYEEPAFDLFPLAALPEAPDVGVGRVGDVTPTTLGAVVQKLKAGCGIGTVMMVGNPDQPVTRVAVCAGAGRSLIGDVLRAKADVYVTGELPHHDALKLAKHGVAAICTLHSNSERPTLKRLAEKLVGFSCVISENDRDPFTMM